MLPQAAIAWIAPANKKPASRSRLFYACEVGIGAGADALGAGCKA
jgi:hypothetical protein